MSTKIQEERAKTAKHRFYCYSVTTGTYPYTICDADAKPQSIARFKTFEEAQIYLVGRRERYIKSGE